MVSMQTQVKKPVQPVQQVQKPVQQSQMQRTVQQQPVQQRTVQPQQQVQQPVQRTVQQQPVQQQQVQQRTQTVTPTTTSTQQSIEDKINSMYDSQYKGQETVLNNNKVGRLEEIQKMIEAKQKEFFGQRVGVDTDSALQMKKTNEMMANNGIRGGDNITAAARNNTDRSNQLQSIQQAEDQFLLEMEMAKNSANRDYATQLAQAQSQGDYQKANALLQQLQKQQEQAWQKDFWKEQQDYNKQWDNEKWDRETAYNDKTWERDKEWQQSQTESDRKWQQDFWQTQADYNKNWDNEKWDRETAYQDKTTESDRKWQQDFWQTQANWDKQQALEEWNRKIEEQKRQESLASSRASSGYGSGSSGSYTSTQVKDMIGSDVLSSLRSGNLDDISSSASRVNSAYQQGYLTDTQYKDYMTNLQSSYTLNEKTQQKVNQGTYGYSQARR